MLAAATLAALAGCTVAPDQSGSAANKEPGRPFHENVCYQCSLRSCALPTRACTLDAVCTAWLECVSVCPTDRTGVAAEGECLLPCGLPVSAQVLFECIQDFANGALSGCELACLPL